MKIVAMIARVLLGLVFVVFGLNMFLHFIPMPPPKGELAGDYMKALFASHYIYAAGLCEVLGGFLVLTGRFTPLGLTLLGPVIVNILLFHATMDPGGLPLAGVVAVLALILVARHRRAFAGLLGRG